MSKAFKAPPKYPHCKPEAKLFTFPQESQHECSAEYSPYLQTLLATENYKIILPVWWIDCHKN